LKGIAIGNAYLSDSLNYNTAPIYAYNHGIIDEEFWNLYGHRCCNGCVGRMFNSKNFSGLC